MNLGKIGGNYNTHSGRDGRVSLGGNAPRRGGVSETSYDRRTGDEARSAARMNLLQDELTVLRDDFPPLGGKRFEVPCGSRCPGYLHGASFLACVPEFLLSASGLGEGFWPTGR